MQQPEERALEALVSLGTHTLTEIQENKSETPEKSFFPPILKK